MRAVIALFLLGISANSYSANPLLVQHADFDSTWTPSWSNIVWYWKMNGGTGYAGAVTVDKGGTTCTTAANKTFVADGKIDQALSLGVTGYGQYLTCASSTYNTISDNLTFSGWFKVQSNTPLNYGSLVSFGVGGTCTNGNLQIQRELTNNKVYLRIDTSGGTNQTLHFTAGSVLNGNWHHLAFTLQSGVVKTYLDGALALSGTYTAGSGFNSYDGATKTCNAMAISSASTLPDTSTFDDFAIWNVVLSASDIATIYNRQVTGKP